MALQDDINSFGSANTAAELLVLAACTANTTTNRTVSVSNVSALPDLNCGTVSTGTIFFVDSISIPVIALDGCWAGLDGRELRNDFNQNVGWGWGTNSYGRLGDGCFFNRPSPVSNITGFSDWVQLSTTPNNGVGVRKNGTIWSWGRGSCGTLGNNCTFTSYSPVSVVGGFSDWKQVQGLYRSMTALRNNGTLWSWGYNSAGELGNGNTQSRSSPVSVVGGFTDWCLIAGLAGTLGLAAIRCNGTAWAWGRNNSGELGDGTTAGRSSPVSVVGGFTDWCGIATGYNHRLGIRSNGTIWSWGANNIGQLGTGDGVSTSSPVSVVGGFTDWCQVAAGRCHSAALRTNGTLWTWGRNEQGQVGDNSTTAKSSPVTVVGGFTDWCKVTSGQYHTSGIRTNGSLWMWGGNSLNQLGDNTTTSRSSPVSVVGGLVWSSVSLAGAFSLGINIQ